LTSAGCDTACTVNHFMLHCNGMQRYYKTYEAACCARTTLCE